MAQALRVACAFVEAQLGSDVGEWKWGRLHVCHFTNQGAGQLGEFLNAPPFPYGT
jgi:acyl-homoserine lactone acylase PvdQ|eukprot:COSAG06_NODE_289_length_18231_cov_20.202515_16_plen_55_part_00